MKTIKQGFELAIGILVIMLLMPIIRFFDFMAMSGTRRKIWMIENGYHSFHSPDGEAIRHCDECGYVGTLSIDKHRYAPMSPDNWGLFCPECRTEIEGPVFITDVSEYVDLCRSTDIMGEMMIVGGYAAYKTVQSHNEKYVMSADYIRKCERAMDRRD